MQIIARLFNLCHYLANLCYSLIYATMPAKNFAMSTHIPTHTIYRHARTLKVSEIFYSLQGEALTSGAPTVFVRLTGCPLRCTYCDTAYAFYGGVRTDFADIFAKIESFACMRVCVTGGEPLAQKETALFLHELVLRGFSVSLETSGALNVQDVPIAVSKVMDLKTPSSGECDKNLWQNIQYLTCHDQIKIVIADRADYEWAKNAIDMHNLIQKVGVVWLSPMFNLHDANDMTHGTPSIATCLAEWILADKLDVRLQLQIHKLIWADARGK